MKLFLTAQCTFLVMPSVQASFSPNMVVQMREGDMVKLRDLEKGSKILTGVAESLEDSSPYSDVYSWFQYDQKKNTEFLQITVHDESHQMSPLEITNDHFLYPQGSNSPVRADSVQVGDSLQTAFGSAEIKSISTVTKQGRMSPLTTDGKMMINFIMVSSYMDHPYNTITHFTISPFRLVCTHVLPEHKLCTTYTEDDALPKGLEMWRNAVGKDASNLELRMILFLGISAISKILELLLMVPLAVWVMMLGLQRIAKQRFTQFQRNHATSSAAAPGGVATNMKTKSN
jgi:Hint module